MLSNVWNIIKTVLFIDAVIKKLKKKNDDSTIKTDEKAKTTTSQGKWK